MDSATGKVPDKARRGSAKELDGQEVMATCTTTSNSKQAELVNYLEITCMGVCIMLRSEAAEAFFRYCCAEVAHCR